MLLSPGRGELSKLVNYNMHKDALQSRLDPDCTCPPNKRVTSAIAKQAACTGYMQNAEKECLGLNSHRPAGFHLASAKAGASKGHH
jgi:hypothetical protein